MEKISNSFATVEDIPPEHVDDDALLGEKTGTARDARDMIRMGKQQLFRRNFNLLTMFGFTAVLMNTWEVMLAASAFGLLNGGTAGMIYIYIVVAVMFFLVTVSMAEMASMAPTAGGQYHWVSEFAPRSVQKQTSYAIGWLCVLGWQTGCAIGCYLAGTAIQGLVVLNYETYAYERWHGSLIAMAIALFLALFNIFLAKYLPMVEGISLALHVLGFFGILITLWVLGPRAPSDQVWTTFLDGGEWGNMGLACLVGMITPISSLLGADSAVHMSEELRNSSKIIPVVMYSTTAFNSVLGFVMLVTFCYTLGDLEEILATPTGYPYIQVFYNITQSKAGASVMTSVLITLSIANSLTNMAAASRQLFAFARDKGVPFHPWVHRVPPGYDVPTNAIIITVIFSWCLHSINIGSSIGFNQIMSLGLTALLTSYFISIGCMALRRIKKQSLLPCSFSLGSLGLPINLLSMAFAALGLVMSFFPPAADPTLEGMNWAILVYSGVLIIAFVYYLFIARFQYDGPVEYVRKLD